MADVGTNLRHLACIQRHGAHFMDGPIPPTKGFGCKHCGLYNVSKEFMEAGMSLWRYEDGHANVSCWKNGRNIFSKSDVSNEEVHHALQLVGYRATNDDPDE